MLGLLGREVSGLVTAGAELYREKQETRDFIERAIPSIEYGKVFTTFSAFHHKFLGFPSRIRILARIRNNR